MFNTISWQQFFITAGFVIIGYYLITTLALYHREIFLWLTNKNKLPVSPPQGHATNLMGTIQPEPVRPIRKQTVEADQIHFGPGTPDEQIEPTTETIMVTGSVADLLQEIKTLAEMIADNNTPIEEGISLFKSLLEHYPHVQDSPFREAVTIIVHTACKETCRYDLDLSQVKQWWKK